MFCKIKRILKPISKTGLSKIDVPDHTAQTEEFGDPTNPKAWKGPWVMLTKPLAIATIVKDINRKQYNQAQDEVGMQILCFLSELQLFIGVFHQYCPYHIHFMANGLGSIGWCHYGSICHKFLLRWRWRKHGDSQQLGLVTPLSWNLPYLIAMTFENFGKLIRVGFTFKLLQLQT